LVKAIVIKPFEATALAACIRVVAQSAIRQQPVA